MIDRVRDQISETTQPGPEHEPDAGDERGPGADRRLQRVQARRERRGTGFLAHDIAPPASVRPTARPGAAAP